MIKKTFPIFVFLGTLMLTMLLLAGCQLGEPTGTTDPEPSTEIVSGSDEPSQQPSSEDYLALSENGNPVYTVVYQSTGLADGASTNDIYKMATSVADKIKDLLPGKTVRVVSSSRIPEGEKIIAFGKIAGISDTYYDGLAYLDWRIEENNGNIAAVGYDYSSFYITSEHLKDAMKVINGELYLNKKVLGTEYRYSYSVPDMTVGGTPLADYVISYGEDESVTLATLLRDQIRTVNGTVLPIEKSSSASHQIRVGLSNLVDGYRISCESGNLNISCKNVLYAELCGMNLKNVLNNVSKKTMDLTDLQKEYSLADGRQLITFNVQNVWNALGTPGTRDDRTVKMLKSYDPDFFCLQEFDIGYRHAENGLISQLSETYAEVAVTGVDPDNIWNPIFYKKDRYTVQESGFVYLPDVTTSNESANYYGGTADHLSRFRSLVWAVMKDNTTNEEFLIGSLHFSYTDGVSVQSGEATAAANAIKSVAARYDKIPVLIAGDYNSNCGNGAAPGVKEMIRQGFTDTYQSAYHRNDFATTHETGKKPTTGYLNHAIDHVLSLNQPEITAYLVITDDDIIPASDHCPTVIQWKK